MLKLNRYFQLIAPTPDRVSELQALPLASFKARAGAFMIDFFIVVLLSIPVGLLLEYRKIAEGHDIHLEINPFHDWWSLIILVLYAGLTTYFGHGQTLGKRLLRIRVVSLTHHRLSFWHSVERALGYGASAAELGFGFYQYFIHPNRQTTHDRIAETIVVAEPKAPRSEP
jgi:uncharacterized RDD family membrane protein YckC